MPEAHDHLPIVRDYDNYCFVLTRNQSFVLGGFEPLAQTVFERGVPLSWKESLPVDEGQFRK